MTEQCSETCFLKKSSQKTRKWFPSKMGNSIDH